jgi:putative transposase
MSGAAMQEAYTATSLATILGITDRSVQRRAKQEQWRFRRKPGRGNGREWVTASMPGDVQAAIVAHEARQQSTPTSPHYEAKPIPEKAHETGLARFQLHADWQKFRRKPKTNKAKADKAFLLAYNSGQSHPSIYKALGKISRSTLFRWDRRLKESDGDYRILCDHRGWAPAEGKQGDIGDEAAEIFLQMYLTPQRPSVLLAYRAMCAVLEQRGLPCPSQRTTYRFVERYTAENHDHVVLMREGEKALADKVGPFITRDDSLLEVGDVLVADGHRLNFDAINPNTGRPGRMTLIVWFDWASRMPVGWEVMPEEHTIAISSALYMAIKNLGKYPKVVYLDNGRAFKSKFFTQAAPDEIPLMQGLYQRLGIQTQFAKPYQGRSKVVERFFGTFDNQAARMLPSHRGRSVADKPAYLARNEKFHRDRHNTFIPTIEQVSDIFRAYLGWYGMQPHHGLKGAKPLEVFAAGRGEGIPVDELTQHFLWRALKKPRRCRIRLAGIDFESDALYGLKQDVACMYSWADLGEIFLYTQQGDYLGVARPVKALHPVAKALGNDLNLLEVQEANKRQARLRKQTLQLARETQTDAEALEALPWMGHQERVPLPAPEPEAPDLDEAPEISQDDKAAIEQAQERWFERQAEMPPYERPDFARRLDRYAHLFNLKTFEGVRLIQADLDFMEQYENSEEYKITGTRFKQLMEWHLSQGEPAQGGEI